MENNNETMAKRIEALAQRIRKGEFEVERINISQSMIDDSQGWPHGIDVRPGLDVYWTIHLKRQIA